MRLPRVALQTIVFGERNRTDFAAVVAEAAAAGYGAIESGNLFAAHGEPCVRRVLDETGVAVAGAHFGYGDYADEVKLAANIEYCRAVGAKHMMCSGVSDTKTVAGYVETSKLFNAVGRRLADVDLVFNYHNHAWEFDDLGGTNGMAILAAETDPDVVKFNIDVFWVTVGGGDPATFIEDHRRRAGYYHFKDGRRLPDGSIEFLELGRGVVDLRGAMAKALELGAEWIVAEQDRTELPHTQAIQMSRDFLRSPLGV